MGRQVEGVMRGGVKGIRSPLGLNLGFLFAGGKYVERKEAGLGGD